MSAAEGPPDQATETRSDHDSNSVQLRVTYLHAGNPRPPHELGSVPAETTVGALKDRLQSELLESPRPEEQRLIYQGRPLLQDTTTLREALRLSGPIGPLPYTIHIIIQPRHAASHFRPDTSADTPAPAAGDGGQAPGAATVPGPTPQPHLNHEHLNAQVERMHAAAQAHLNILNQQLHAIQHQHGLNMNPNQRFNTTVHVNGHLVQPIQLPPAVNGQPAPTPTLANPSGRQPHAPAQPHGAPAHPQAIPGPIFLNAGQQFGNPPFQRPLSVPPTARAFGPPQPYGVPPQLPVFPPLPRVAGAIPVAGAAVQVNAPQPTQPTVWLASSRNGPEALLFAPGHGYFSSGGAAAALIQRNDAPMPNLQAQMNLMRSSVVPVPAQNDRPAVQPRVAAPANPQQPPIGPIPGPLALQRPLQPGQPAVAQIRPRALGDDLMGLVIQRGWLFLRLYMFMFVLSEPGTWRRYLLLGLALIVCLLPRQNPLSHLMVAARRHIDNLIGPPAPQRPAGQQPPQAGADAAARPPPVRGAVNITPEQAATRILAEQQHQRAGANGNDNQQPPNVLRDTFYHIEQAVALFLASLIPGVGERHVAAREEQRREQLRVEMERANAERAATEAAEEERRRGDVQTQEQTEAAANGGEHQDNGAGKGKERETVNTSREETTAEGVSTGVESTPNRGAASSSVRAEGSGEQQLRERIPANPSEQGS